MSIATGTKLGRYQIRSKIGEGGMGEVYLALDTELDRTVAIKILPEAFASDQQRLQRFIQEAKAASALNHPSILTIHEIGIAGVSRFIATEFIDGETLRRHIKSSTRLPDILEIGIQVGGALAAAHAAGIVHRDIKPDNIMVRRDGIVKVLDFGLAKLTADDSGTIDTQAPTKNLLQTDPGTVVGTALYMSPEQARRLPVDARTDIFSLGVVLYEMVAGCLPFTGATTSEVLASIISEKEPQPLARFAREVPAEMERIVAKALAKDREERYQTVKDLLIDLRKLKRQLEFESERKRSSGPAANSQARTTGSPAQADLETIVEAAASPTSNAALASRIKLHRSALLIALAALGIAAATVAYFVSRGSNPGTQRIESLAVLPLMNASGDPNTEYLSDGITDSLINNLSQLPNLKVMSRNSVFRFKGREADAQAAARELNVRAVLTGRVVQRGDDLSVIVELVNAQDNRHLWGAQYNRKLADIFAVQEDIAKEISEKLRLHLSGEEQKLLTRRYTNNTEAYQLYLKCNFYWNKFTPEAERTAIDYCTQAIVKDPNFALPYAGLVHGYQVSANNGWMRPHDAYPKAKAAIARALELDPHNPSLLTAVASTAMFYDWDWAAAEKGFKRANEVDPNYWHVHELYAYLLTALGRIDEAIVEARRAQEIDPLSRIAHVSASHPYYFSGQHERSMAETRKALDLDPGFMAAHRNLARSLLQQGKYDEAISAYNQSINLSGRIPQTLGELGQAYAMAGKRAEALKLLEELKVLSTSQYVSPLYYAYLYTGLGDRERAFSYLEEAYQERSTWLMWIKVDPRFDSLRSDPRFADLLRRMKLA